MRAKSPVAALLWSALFCSGLAVRPSVAAAQDGFDAHGFAMSANDGDPRDPLTVPRAGRIHAGELWGTGVFEYADDPLVRELIYPDARPHVIEKVVDSLMALNLSAGVAVHERLRLDVEAPIFLAVTGFGSGTTSAPQGAGIGDVRVGAMTSLVRPKPSASGGLGIGLAPYVVLPTGNDGAFLGGGGLAGGFDVAVTYELPQLTLTGALGPTFNPGVSVDGAAYGQDAVSGGIAVGYSPIRELGLNVEARMSMGLGDATTIGEVSPGEVLGSARYRMSNGLHFLAGAGTAITPGAGAAKLRVLFGVGYGKIEMNFTDRDLDGIANDEDACPDEAETLNGYQDTDGCPDQGGRLLMTTRIDGMIETEVALSVVGSGVLEHAESDLTPVAIEVPAGVYEVRGVTPGFQGRERVSVQSGEYPVQLELGPVVPGFVSVNVFDANHSVVQSAGLSIIGDGAPLDATRRLGPEGLQSYELPPGDYLVYVKARDLGMYRKNFSLEPGQRLTIDAELHDPRAVLQGDRIEVSEKVYFETGSDVIKPESYSLLEEIATLLVSEQRVRLVEIQGHTDAQGSEQDNQALSDRRAAAVRSALINNGVAGSRLQWRGFGESVSIASNDTAAGRAENRRVEFRILQMD